MRPAAERARSWNVIAEQWHNAPVPMDEIALKRDSHLFTGCPLSGRPDLPILRPLFSREGISPNTPGGLHGHRGQARSTPADKHLIGQADLYDQRCL